MGLKSTWNCLIIIAKSLVEGTCCGICHEEITKPYGSGKEISLRHLPILNRKVYIVIRPLKYQCIDCEDHPVITQKLPWYVQKSPFTKAYDEHILLELINSTVKDVSIKEGVGYEAVMGVINRWIDVNVEWDNLDRIDAIGLDEISLKKGHKKYVTIVTGLIGKKIIILAVLDGREKKTVKEFLKKIGSLVIPVIAYSLKLQHDI